MTSDLPEERMMEGDIVPDYAQGTRQVHDVSVILLGDKTARLMPAIRSLTKMLFETEIKEFDTKLDIIITTQEKDDESFEEVLRWGNLLMERLDWKVTLLINDHKKGKLMADAIRQAKGEVLVFLTPDFIIDRARNARGLINQLHVPMDYGVSLIKGNYEVSVASVDPGFGTVVLSSPTPYVTEPYGVTSFGGLKEYSHYFPFRHLSTIRVKRDLVINHLDFLSNFDEGLDIALGAVAVYEGAGMKTTPDLFVNMLTTPRPPDYGVLRKEISIMESYFPDMTEYTGRSYFDYIKGAKFDVENERY